MKMRHLLCLLSAPALGCSFLVELAPGRCFSPEECFEGEVCQFVEQSQDGGFCVGTGANNLSFSVDISPLPGQGLLREQLPISGNLFQEGVADIGLIELGATVKVNGHAVAVGGSGSLSVLVRATNTQAPLIPEAGPEIFEAQSDAKGTFSLFVREGGIYDIVAIPLSDPTLPPVVLRGVPLPTAGNTDLLLNFDGTRRLSGQVTLEGQPLEGMRVFAQVLNPNGSVDPDLRSTQAITLADGSFTISLPREALSFLLRVEPVAEGPNSLLPTRSALLSETIALDGLTLLSGAIELGPAEAPRTFFGHVFGPAANKGAPNIDAAETTILTFTRIEEPGSDRSFSRRVQVDTAGDFVVDLLPGSYNVSASTPPGHELASGLIEGVQAECAEDPCLLPELELQRRKLISGEILDPTGQNTDEIFTIEARPAGQPSAGVVGTAVSDSLGRYQLLLDPGVYDLSFTPPAGGIPTGFLFGLDATELDVFGDAAKLFLVSPSVVSGTIIGPEIMGGIGVLATVRVYAQSFDGSLYYLVTTATTDGAGNFALAVPNSSGAESLFGPLAPPNP